MIFFTFILSKASSVVSFESSSTWDV
jgi:hypothetical protein